MLVRVTLGLVLLAVLVCASPGAAQDRDTKVRNDRARLADDDHWLYNDLATARRLAASENKPLLVVFRCIPCEACALLDEQVVAREPGVRALMDRYICVRIPMGNAMDLAQFQFDYDLSFTAFLMNADGVIYGRYGTRSSRDEADKDVSLEGFAAALEAGLRLHAGYPGNKALLAGKQPRPVERKRPEEYPALAGKYQPLIDYEGATARSCLHCHQIREAERLTFRTAGRPLPDQVLYPFPTVDTIGLSLDPKSRARVTQVERGSPAARAGWQAGDEIVQLGGQAILSAADIQWVLHHAGESADLPATVRRGDDLRQTTLALPAGWRRETDIGWRVSTWDLRRAALGGMVLEPTTEEQRRQLGIDSNSLALHVRGVGQFGQHAVAKNAGVQKGDIVVRYGPVRDAATESSVIAAILNSTRPGDTVELEVLREGQRRTMRIRMQ